MSSLNLVQLIGNLGNDPETKFGGDGSAITTISVATSEQWKDKITGEKKERTEWHRVVFFGKLAEIAGEYLHKGSKVYISGQFRTNKYKDNDGHDRYSTSVVASEMKMLDRKPGSEEGGERPARAQNATSRPAQSAPPADNFEDDDIPF